MARCRGCGVKLRGSVESCPRCGLEAPIALKVPTGGWSTPRAIVVLVLLIVALIALHRFGETATPQGGTQAEGMARQWRPDDQVGDPYANATADHKAKQKEGFLAFVRVAYFAFGCKVFMTVAATQSEGFMQVVVAGMWNSLGRPIVTAAELAAAKANGAARAANPAGCQYWHEHPEDVYQIRQAARAAFQN